MAVRVDRQGSIVSDFHTVQGKPRLAVAGGGYRGENKSTIVSHRYYLQDASFLVAISGNEDLLAEIYTAMMHPAYIPFLGRKACLPSVPMVPSLKYYDSLEMALKHEPLSARHDSIDVTAEFDDAIESGMEDSRNDKVNNFSSRQFSERTVYRKLIHVELL
jgi:CRISPR system Cascade subunit CasD